MDKLDQLKKKIEEVQTKSLVASEMKAFITLVISVANESKEELLKLSDDNIQTIKDSISYIEENYSKQVDSLKNEKNSMVSDFNEKVDNLKALIKEAKNLKPLEKIIERIETIHETPIITNEIKEVAKYESPNQIVDKLNTLEEVIDQKVIKGLTKKITDLSSNIAHNISKGSSTPLINGKLAKNINFTGATVSYSGDNANVVITGGGAGTPAGSSGDIQWNDGGSFGGFGTFNGTNALDLTGISITSAGLTTTGIFQQSGDGASFNVSGSNFTVSSTTYSAGLISVDDSGTVLLGDLFSSVNSTQISIIDATGTIDYYAVNGHTFTGQVATGAGTSSVVGSANVPLTVTETINGYVGLQVQNLSNGSTASSDFVVANDIDDGTLATGNYLDIGIGSSANTDPLFPALNGANNTYMYAVGGKLSIGTATANKSINFFTGGLEYSNRRMIITSGGSVGFGTIAPNNFMSIAPVRYLTGTASQSGTTVTGVGTTWTSAMVGNLFEFDDGTSAGTITGFTSTTSLTVSISQTVSSQTYSIHYPGIEVSSTGAVGLGTTTPTAKLDVVTDGLGTTSPDISGIVLSNTTPSTSGVTRQFSPVLRFRGSAWKTDATAASQTIDFKQYLSTASGTSAPSGDMVWTASINGGTYVSLMGISSAGALTLYQGLPRTLDINASSSTIVGFRIFNTNNASVSAHARYEMTTGGASGGDPYTAYTVNGVTVWSQGIDNSDSDTFKISESATLGTNDRFILRTGGLTSVRVGLSTKQATLGGSIKKYFTSVGNVTTGEDDLFTYTTEANIFGTNGDNIEGEYSGTTAANANNKTFKFYFAGTNLLNSGALALNDKNWKFTFTIIRVSSTVVRYSVEFDYEGNTATILEVGELTGLTLSGTNILKITGEATSTDDIVATMGTVKANPASV